MMTWTFCKSAPSSLKRKGWRIHAQYLQPGRGARQELSAGRHTYGQLDTRSWRYSSHQRAKRHPWPAFHPRHLFQRQQQCHPAGQGGMCRLFLTETFRYHWAGSHCTGGHQPAHTAELSPLENWNQPIIQNFIRKNKNLPHLILFSLSLRNNT